MSAVNLQIEANPEAVAEAAAALVLAALHLAEPTLTLALAGGSTPQRLYRRLAREPEQPWSKLRLFLGDERALPDGHPDRNTSMAMGALVEPLGLSTSQVIFPHAGAEDLGAAALAYQQRLLQEVGDPPCLDIVLLGMGGDGHTASLFPGEPPATGWVAAVQAPRDTAARQRLTFTPATLLAAKQVFVLITGRDKAERLAAVFEGRDEGPLAQLLDARRGETRLIVDTAAASGLAGSQ